MPTRYWWLNDESKTILERGYLLSGETVEDAVNRVCKTACKWLKRDDLFQKFKDNIEFGWMSLATPIWCNFGSQRGMPISCFGTSIPDSIEGISDCLSEVIYQTKIGGGTSAYFGKVRHRGAPITDNGESGGSVSFMKLYNTAISVISQGSIRRGNMAVYLDIDHPDIEEFLSIKDVNSDIQNLFTGICVPDKWMKEMIDGDQKKRILWAKILTSRREKGLPYIFFIDNVNNNKPQVYKDKNLRIDASNLCIEICLPASETESFVCDLSSMNLEVYNEWKDTDAVQVGTYLLDAVMEEFIHKSYGIKHLIKAHTFAKNHRALGLGVLGYHSYLQKNMIPFESINAKAWNNEVFKFIQKESLIASQNLAKEYGEPEILKGYGLRNTTRTAIAPTTSSSAILGQTSMGIEPYSSNYYKVGLAKGNFMRKNKYLQKLLEQKKKDNDEVWKSILINKGSVQHLDFLTEEEKNVFKTFKEISQMEIIIHASIRQKYICQSQSLNINIPPEVSPKDLNKLIIEAWKLGIKSLYYQRSESVSQNLIQNLTNCVSCEG
jgi:ribonucleoside-diphosphate reductase alpha chain